MFGDSISLVLFLFIFALVTATAILSAGYDLRDRNEPRFLKSLYSSGWLVLIFSFLTLVLTAVQNGYSEYKSAKENKERDSAIRSDYAKSVERITENYENKTGELKNRYDTSTTNIINALAEYGLSYNSRTKKLENLIKDSVRTRPDPTFDIIEIKKHTETETHKMLAVAFISKDAGCRNVDLNVSILISDFLDGPYTLCTNEIYKESQLGMNDDRTVFYALPKKFKYYNLVFFIVKGSYQNTDRSKIFPINTVWCFNVNSGTTTSVIGKTKEDLFKFIGYYGY